MEQVVRVAAGEEAAMWRDALSAPRALDGTKVLKEDGGSWVRRAMVMGRDVVVKCRVLNSAGRKFKHAIGMGHGHKHWRGAERLMRAGIATGKPLALLRAKVDGTLCEVLVLEFVEGKTLLEVLDEIARGAGPGVREQHAIARAVGRTIAAMDEACCNNRDHKPSNLIVLNTAESEPQIAVIDCVGVRWGENSFASLEALTIEPIGCRCLPRKAIWMSVLAYLYGGHTARQQRVDMHEIVQATIWLVERAVKGHGDPRPRVDPLGKR